MKIVNIEKFNLNSLNDDQLFILNKSVLPEIEKVINSIDAQNLLIKISKEKSKKDEMLYSPTDLNKSFSRKLIDEKYEKARLSYGLYTSLKEYQNNFDPLLVIGDSNKDNKRNNVQDSRIASSYDEVDFYKILYKNTSSLSVAVEIQFGKYMAMTRDNLYKLNFFENIGASNVGISICPTQSMTKKMSSGIGFYEKSLGELNNSNITHRFILIGICP